MNPGDVWTLYRRELRAALRERSVVVNSFLLPVFLYPVVLWLTFSALGFVQGLAEGFDSRVAVFGVPVAHSRVVESLRVRDDLVLVDGYPSPDSARSAVRAGELDAVLELVPPEEGAALLDENFAARISFDGSESRSRTARDRMESLLQRYRDAWIEEEANRLGLSEGEFGMFRVQGRNVSTGSEMGAFVLSEMVPVFLVLMVALGCFVPAIDSTAGERERGTWETLMTVAASRTSVVTAKYLYVATLGTAAGVLNIGAMAASVGAVLGPIAGGQAAEMSFEYPLRAIPVMLLGALILALFFAAAMMILAAFARTFRDGQSMVTPVYWLAVIPLFLGQAPDQHLTAELALVPIVNVTLMIRDAIQGIFSWPLVLESSAVGLLMVTACIWIARWILDFEDVLMGSYDGSFWRFLRERVRS
ncbi:MAG: ABC transporter permease [Gemmatimonadota bacterium]